MIELQKRPNKAVNTVILLTLVCLTALSCKHSLEPNESRLTEKSRFVRPDWLALPEGIIARQDGQSEMVYRKNRVLDLPLGLKQARDASLEIFASRLSEEALKLVGDNSRVACLARDSSRKHRVEESVLKVFREGIDDQCIRDIYFEGGSAVSTEIPGEKTYAVMVYLSLSEKFVQKLNRQVATVLKQEQVSSPCR